MARPLQKKKNKSSLPRVRQKPKSKAVNIKSNAIVAANWDQSLTLRQNYKNLGLTSRLKSSTGGVEKKYKGEAKVEYDGLSTPRSKKKTQLELGRVKVVRDETGAITGVVREEGDEKKPNPLNDPLNELSDEEQGGMDGRKGSPMNGFGGGGIVPELEELAKYEKCRRPRKQSQREQEWIQQLVDQHGKDYRAMVWDRKLNPMQQSEGDLKRRIGIWLKEKGTERSDEVMDEG